MKLDSPELRISGERVELSGEWTLAAMLPRLTALKTGLHEAAVAQKGWNLERVNRLDSAAAALLWQAWGRSWPADVQVGEPLRLIIERAARVPEAVPLPETPRKSPVEAVGRVILRILRQSGDVLALFGQLLLDVAYLVRRPKEIPWTEFSANLYKVGAQALPVVALVGFLIGITISYLSSLQLKAYGADLFIVNILGISIIRELGPVLVAVLVAGRSGSAMTAQIGVMRVTEEIDALAVMGISRSLRIVLPKVAALSLAMPLLVLWTSAAALFGGMVAANLQLDLSYGYFIDNLPRAVPIANLVIGLCKGVVFGFFIALIACHFGLRVKPNTESLSANTTASVVAAITTVIIVDAIFAILTKDFGMPT